MIENIPVFYFDMDGVLAVFEEDIPKSEILDPAKRYFRYAPPDARALNLARALHAMGPEICDVQVLTRIFADQEPSDKLLQSKDKNKWAADRLPWLRLPQGRNKYHCLDRNKAQFLLGIPSEQRRYHILIDDEITQLRTWSDIGGTAVQYLQPDRRMSRWYGHVIDRDDSPWTALATLCRVGAGVMSEKSGMTSRPRPETEPFTEPAQTRSL